MTDRNIDANRANDTAYTHSQESDRKASFNLQRTLKQLVDYKNSAVPVIGFVDHESFSEELVSFLNQLLSRGCIDYLILDGEVLPEEFELAMHGQLGQGSANKQVVTHLNEAVRKAAWDGLGLGAGVGRFMKNHPEHFPQLEYSMSYNAWHAGVPCCVYPELTPLGLWRSSNTAAWGATLGQDLACLAGFLAKTKEIALVGITGLEPMQRLLQVLGFDVGVSGVEVDVLRTPLAMGSLLQDLCYGLVCSKCEGSNKPRVLQEFEQRNPHLLDVSGDLLRASGACRLSLEQGGTIYVYGNGGSMADALHISGELLKSYLLSREIDRVTKERLQTCWGGSELAANLEGGLRCVVLGLNPALSTAVDNDFSMRYMQPVQELWTLGRPNDVFIGISTSGNAANIAYLTQVAHVKDMTVIGLTGPDGGKLAQMADISIKAPGQGTDRIQENHILIYHCLCQMLEEHFFGEARL